MIPYWVAMICGWSFGMSLSGLGLAARLGATPLQLVIIAGFGVWNLAVCVEFLRLLWVRQSS